MVYDSEVNRHQNFSFALLAIVLFAALLVAQTANFDGRPAVILRNDKIELTILTRGATLANLILRDDAEKLSPYWNTDRALKPNGPPPSPPAGAIGHFLCLDGFGAPSDEEASAGIPFHGEASKQQFKVSELGTPSFKSTVFEVQLPLAQEAITRTITLLDGENVVYVN